MINEMDLFEAECKLLCYKGNMSRSNLGSFYNNEQTNWMYQMWISSKNRQGCKIVPVEPTVEMLEKVETEKEFLFHVSGEYYDLGIPSDTASEIYKAMIGAVE